jgi:hypothetical protein
MLNTRIFDCVVIGNLKSGGEFVYTCENREQVELAAGICAFAVAIVFVFQAIVKQRWREVEMGRERSERRERGLWEDKGKRAGPTPLCS